MAATPTDSSILARSRQTMFPLSQPRRIFTVTGVPWAPRITASATRQALSRSRSRPEPSPLLATLGTGQPMLMSMMSGWATSRMMAAPSFMQARSLPKICTPPGCSSGPSSMRGRVFLS